MAQPLSQACMRFRAYRDQILYPMSLEFRAKLEDRRLRLHDAFAANVFVAHSLDYMHEVARAVGDGINRADFARSFDERYQLSEIFFSRHKFELVDLINNSLKHVEVDPARKANRAPLAHYGPISFQVLSEREGRVYCVLGRYRFDYGRIVLRPILDLLTCLSLRCDRDVLSLVRGEIHRTSDVSDAPDTLALIDEWEDPIDRMIADCNRPCSACGEHADHCECGVFIYDGKSGRYEPIEDPSFDFHAVMSAISGAYRRE